MRLAIIDYNAVSRNNVFNVCLNTFDKEHIPLKGLIQFGDNNMFLDFMEHNYFDLIILDVYMGINDYSGIELVKKIHRVDERVRVAFCNCNEMGDFDSAVIDAFPFIIKPLLVDDIPNLIHTLHAMDLNNHHAILLPNGQEIYLKTLLYTECRGHDIYFYFSTREDFHIRILQKDLVSLFQPFPYICSISSAINVNFQNVLKQIKDEFRLIDGSIVRIPRRRCREIRERYAEFLRDEKC